MVVKPIFRIVALALVLAIAVGCRKVQSPVAAPSPSVSEELEQKAPSQPEQELSIEAKVASGQWTELDDELGVDEEVEAIIEPFRTKLQAVMQEEIGVAKEPLDRGRPESALGNFVADIILSFARNQIDEDTDFSLMNRGGIRLPVLPTGPITVADIYQLVPFDNLVVVLTMTGSQVDELLQSLARKQGEPLSGIVYQLTPSSEAEGEWKATDIQIGGVDLDPNEIYKIATLDYLAGIGGELAVLQEASQRQDGQRFLRDIMVDAIRSKKTITPETDGRVTYSNETSEEQ